MKEKVMKRKRSHEFTVLYVHRHLYYIKYAHIDRKYTHTHTETQRKPSLKLQTEPRMRNLKSNAWLLKEQIQAETQH